MRSDVRLEWFQGRKLHTLATHSQTSESMSWHWSSSPVRGKREKKFHSWFWRASCRGNQRSVISSATTRTISIDADELCQVRLRHFLSYESWARLDLRRREASVAARVAQQMLARAEKARRAESSDAAYRKWLTTKRPSVHLASPAPHGEAEAARLRGKAGLEIWRSRTWRTDLGLGDKFRIKDRTAELDAKLKRANFKLVLRWYFLRLKRYCARHKWLVRKQQERAVIELQAKDKRQSSAASRKAAGQSEKEKWRRHEWRRIKGLEGKLRPQTTRSQRYRDDAAKMRAAERQHRRDREHELNWRSVF